MTQAYPLIWPAGWPRTRNRKSAPFKVSAPQARKEMIEEIRRLGGTNIIISTDQPVNKDGSPTLRRTWGDPGIAAYFTRKGMPVVLACDLYAEPHNNMRAIGKTAEAMRGIERWGASDMLDRAFRGFEALPAPEQWWQVLEVPEDAGVAEIEHAYRGKARAAHPDTGGSDAAMARINAARDAGRTARA